MGGGGVGGAGASNGGTGGGGAATGGSSGSPVLRARRARAVSLRAPAATAGTGGKGGHGWIGRFRWWQAGNGEPGLLESDAAPANGVVTVANEHIYTFPASYNGTTPMPLLLGFHANGNPINQIQNLTNGSALETAFVRAFPKSAGSGWVYNTDITRVRAMWDDLVNNYCVDTSHVFGTGHSSGAQMVVQMLCNGEMRFRGVAPVAASKYCNSHAGRRGHVHPGPDGRPTRQQQRRGRCAGLQNEQHVPKHECSEDGRCDVSELVRQHAGDSGLHHVRRLLGAHALVLAQRQRLQLDGRPPARLALLRLERHGRFFPGFVDSKVQ